MRLRVQTIPPLPDLKAWFVPRPTSTILSVKSIRELKQVLCHDIEQLHGVKKIRLLLDDFELLDNLPYDEVLRDGDLISIQVSQEVIVESEAVKKRKRRDFVQDSPARKRSKPISGLITRKKTRAIASSTDSSVSDRSSESSSSTDTGTSSENESDASSSDTSSSESSDESAESGSSSPSPTRVLPPRAERLTAPAVHVPPGYGKPSTQRRNRRRRLKRQRNRETEEAKNVPPRGISDVNMTPLGEAPSQKTPKATTEDISAKPTTRQMESQSVVSESRSATLDNANGDIMMVSLRNKNKKKNFRQTMAAPAVRKIVFDDNGDVERAASSTPMPIKETRPAGPDVDVVQEDRSAYFPSRVFPPSELAAAGLLPSNVIVTSVEFGRQYKKRKQKRDTHEEEQVSRIVNPYQDDDEANYEDANFDLPYGDEENNVVISHQGFDWKAAEANWERFPLIQTPDQLYTGVLVCWQGLAINPQTFTPEYLIGAGRVEKVAGTTTTIRQLLRPGTETAAAFGIGNESGGEGDEEDYTWDDISGLGWRIAKL